MEQKQVKINEVYEIIDFITLEKEEVEVISINGIEAFVEYINRPISKRSYENVTIFRLKEKNK